MEDAREAVRRLMLVIESDERPLPPDPCRDQDSALCRQVRAAARLNAEAETLVAGVEVFDHGSDTNALRRRLNRISANNMWAEVRLQALAGDWAAAPSELPPDPCAPAILSDIDVLGSSAEAASVAAGELDTCSSAASVMRRLGHVTANLRAASARLEGISGDPGADRDAELDAIIGEAEAVAAMAEALKSTIVIVPPFDVE